jgi:hypothetical protein
VNEEALAQRGAAATKRKENGKKVVKSYKGKISEGFHTVISSVP